MLETAHTLSKVREQFWVPQGKAEVIAVLKKCTLCRRHEGAALRLPPFPSLPKERVSASAPFQHVGVDYLGPLYVVDHGESKKVWVCLFTCLAIRAVHLELVSSLDTTTFINCLRRFAGRRGIPSSILSDNAPQFLLASAVFDSAWGSDHLRL